MKIFKDFNFTIKQTGEDIWEGKISTCNHYLHIYVRANERFWLTIIHPLAKAAENWSCEEKGRDKCTLHKVLIRYRLPEVYDSKDYVVVMEKCRTHIQAERRLLDFILRIRAYHELTCPGLEVERRENPSRVGGHCMGIFDARMNAVETAETEEFTDRVKDIKEMILDLSRWLEDYERRRSGYERSFERDYETIRAELSLFIKPADRPLRFKPDSCDRKKWAPRFRIEE